MTNQAELEKWIRDGLNQGSSPESLKSQLISSGYDTSLVDKVLQENSGSAPPDNANASPAPQNISSISESNTYDKSTPNTTNSKEGYQGNSANQDSTSPAQNTQDTGTQAPPNNIQQSNTDNEFHKMGFIDTAKKVLFKTEEFFVEMPPEGGYTKPLKFATINYFVFSILISLFTYLLHDASPFTTITIIIFVLVGGTIAQFIFATIAHINLKLLGSDRKYEVTFRVIAYLSALIYLLFVPVVGFFAPFIIMYFTAIAFTKTHRITTIKAIIAVVASIMLFSISYSLVIIIALMSVGPVA